MRHTLPRSRIMSKSQGTIDRSLKEGTKSFVLLAVLLSAICLAGFATARSGSPNDTPANLSADEEKTAAFVLAGVRHSQEQFKSGIFRVNGRLVKKDRDSTKEWEQFLNVFGGLQIDPEATFRFDRRDSMSPDASLVEPRRYILTAEKAIYWGGGGNVGISRPDFDDIVRLSGFFDVRTMGLATFGEFVGGRRYEAVTEWLFSQKLGEVEMASNGLYRLAWFYDPHASGSYSHKHVVWFDGAKGFLPIRMEARRRGANAGEWLEPLTTNEATYRKVSGVWIPVHARIESQHSKDVEQWYELSFDWERVNSPLPKHMFSVVGFEVPKHVRVIDDRLGSRIDLGRVGNLDEYDSASLERERNDGVRIGRIVGYVSVSGALLVAAIWFVLRARKRKAMPK